MRLSLVCCMNRPEVARSCLLASPDLCAEHRPPVLMLQGMGSAAEGLARGSAWCSTRWLVLVHQDVWLPAGWVDQMSAALADLEARVPHAVVAGVYGVGADGGHKGYVQDRGQWIGAPVAAPAEVRSLDELLLAVRMDAGLSITAGLGWHLYGTDVCLQAQSRGGVAVVVDAPCEHRATLLRMATNAQEWQALSQVAGAFNASAAQLAKAWPQAMPVQTTVCEVGPGRVLELPCVPGGCV